MDTRENRFLEDVRKKVWMAFTGGKPTIKEQREKGGNPDICTVFEWLRIFVLDSASSEKLRENCKKGRIICGECKELLIDSLTKMLKEHSLKRKRALNGLQDYFIHKITIPKEILLMER